MSELLVLAPLRVEAAAVRGAGRVLRTGMGPDRARIAAARALAIDARAVAVAGVAGGISPHLRPGDLVCATELRGDDGTAVSVPASAQLAAALRRFGLRVHEGPIASTARILPPADRGRLDGVLAVDMESAWLAAGAGGRPFAVVRAIADPSGRRLTDPRILPEGIKALRSLLRSRPALGEWARSLACVEPVMIEDVEKELVG